MNMDYAKKRCPGIFALLTSVPVSLDGNLRTLAQPQPDMLHPTRELAVQRCEMRLLKNDFAHCFGLIRCAAVEEAPTLGQVRALKLPDFDQERMFPAVGWQEIENDFSAKGNRSSSA